MKNLEKKRIKARQRLDITTSKLGVLLGGSGLIGGAILHYLKKKSSEEMVILSPNSKKISLREPKDIRRYIKRYRPDFIINCAMASLDSDAELAYEINCIGAIRLAKIALKYQIPYIYFSSAAVLPMAEDLIEEDCLPLHEKMSNYAKSKIMTETILQHMHETQGLDFTVIRLGVVYGKHDHKTKGFQRMLFAIADESMPFIFSKPNALHSYTYTKKIPPFIDYILNNRGEFGGQIYNFVDKDPVELVTLIKTIKSTLGSKTPRNMCVPYPMATFGQRIIRWIIKKLRIIGIDSKVPAELMFMESFYQTQTLSTQKLQESSYVDPTPDVTVFTQLQEMIDYYIKRWHHLNLLMNHEHSLDNLNKRSSEFLQSPNKLLEELKDSSALPLGEFDRLF